MTPFQTATALLQVRGLRQGRALSCLPASFWGHRQDSQHPQPPWSPPSRVPHPRGHPTQGCIPGPPKSWLALGISQLGRPWLGAASPSPSSLSLSPTHLESPASARPRCQSLFTNWLASLCSACRQTRHHQHSPAPHCPAPGPKLGSPTLGPHPTGVPRAGDTHTPHSGLVSAGASSHSPWENLFGEQPPP